MRLNGGISEWCKMDMGLRQGCMKSSWLFNAFMVGSEREMGLLLGTAEPWWKGMEMGRMMGLFISVLE